MTDEEWSLLESHWWDRVRVRATFLALATRAQKAEERFSVAERRLAEARTNAERAMAERDAALGIADLLGRAITRGDAEEQADIAAWIEEHIA